MEQAVSGDGGSQLGHVGRSIYLDTVQGEILYSHALAKQFWGKIFASAAWV